jgi:hypothetical protein
MWAEVVVTHLIHVNQFFSPRFETCASTLQLKTRDKQGIVRHHITVQCERHTGERICVFRFSVLKLFTDG